MENIEKIYYNIKDLKKDCKKIHFEIKEIQKFKPDLILGIARGGAVPATYLAYQFDVPLLTLSISFYKGMLKNYDADKSAMIIQIHNFLTVNNITNQNILIVDDIVDSGETMLTIKNFITGKYRNKVKFVSLYKAENAPKKAEPDFYLYEKPKNSWVIFPWEIF